MTCTFKVRKVGHMQRSIYKALIAWNDLRAVRRSVQTGSARPVARRVGRRIYGKATGRIARRLFG